MESAGQRRVGHPLLPNLPWNHSAGAETLIGQTTTPITKYTDTTADPNVPDYFYTVTAVNAATTPTGNASNEIDLPIVVPPPPASIVASCPGLTVLTDPAGDSTSRPASAWHRPALLASGPAVPGRRRAAHRLHASTTDPGVAAAARRLGLVCLDEDRQRPTTL